MKLLYLLPAALHALCAFAAPAPAPEPEPAPYIVTEYVVLSVYTHSGYTYTGDTYTNIDEPSYLTNTRNVIPTATTWTAISEETSTTYDHVTIVEVVLPTGVATRVSTTPFALDIHYVVPITYTPSASCKQTWSYVSNVPIHIPTQVESQITPIASITSVSTYNGNGYYTQAVYTSVYAVVAQSQIDPDVYTSASLFYAPSRLSYCATPSQNCYTSTAADAVLTATCSVYWSYSSSNYYSDYNYYDDSWYRTTLIIAITIPVGWVFVWLIAGLVESFYSFKGLMLGKKRKRGLPYSWCCISWLFLCWAGPTYAAKSTEEKAELKTKWEAYTAGEKFKLWMKWGFRWKYPDVLGEEPEMAKRPFRQGCL